MSVVAIILQVLVGIAFVGSGGSKLAGTESWRGEFKRFGYSVRFMYLTGFLQVAGAVGMFVGVFAPLWGALASVLLAGVMAGAVYSHVRAGDSFVKAVPPLALLVLSAAVSAIYVLA